MAAIAAPRMGSRRGLGAPAAGAKHLGRARARQPDRRKQARYDPARPRCHQGSGAMSSRAVQALPRWRLPVVVLLLGALLCLLTWRLLSLQVLDTARGYEF